MKVTCSAICGAAIFNNLGQMFSVPVAWLISIHLKDILKPFPFSILEIANLLSAAKFAKLFMTSIFNRPFYLCSNIYKTLVKCICNFIRIFSVRIFNFNRSTVFQHQILEMLQGLPLLFLMKDWCWSLLALFINEITLILRNLYSSVFPCDLRLSLANGINNFRWNPVSLIFTVWKRRRACASVVRKPPKKGFRRTLIISLLVWKADRGFTCWISFAPVFSFITVEFLYLLYFLVISWFICFRRWCIDKLWVFHTNQTTMCLDPYLNYGWGLRR